MARLWNMTATSLFAFAILLVFGGVLRSADEKDDKIDVEAIKKATKKAILGEKTDKLDLSYITEDFVRKAMKEAKELEPGVIRDEEGKVRNKVKGINENYGHHTWVNPNNNWLYFQGYTCSQTNWYYIQRNYATFYWSSCPGGYWLFKISWITRDLSK